MSAPPKTRLQVSVEEEMAIRAAVRTADLALLGARYRLADSSHVENLIALLSDPAVSDPIYDLPRPFTHDVLSAWISDARGKQARGEAILAVSLDEEGVVAGYSISPSGPSDRQQNSRGRNAPTGKAGAAERSAPRAVSAGCSTISACG
jgi:hypothetical protein